MTELYAKIYDILKEEESVGIVPPLPGWNLSFSIKWDFFVNGKALSTKLILAFDSRFPESFPRVFLENRFFDTIKWIPHVEVNKSGMPYACTFDTSNTQIIPGRELSLVRETIRRARSIIRSGISKENEQDFLSEFQAYWRHEYEANALPKSGYLFVGGPPVEFPVILKAIRVGSLIGKYHTVIFSGDNESSAFFSSVKEHLRTSFRSMTVVYIGDVSFLDRPPYRLTTPQLLDCIENEGINLHVVEEFVSSDESDNLIVAKVSAESKNNMFVGWNVDQKNVKGFRGRWNKIRECPTSSIQRISIDHYSRQRLLLRTSGVTRSAALPREVCYVGVGSVGSHLYGLMQDMEFDSVCFVDTEMLTIENIKRHLLGLDQVGSTKASAMARYAACSKPEGRYNVKEESVVTLLESPTFGTAFDLVLVSVGREDVEGHVRNAIYDRQLLSPVIFLWVEPFLCAGHALYMAPDTDRAVEALCYPDGLFVGNLIDPKVYASTSSPLFMNDYGCQGSYIPYSGNNLRLFLSAVLPWINAVSSLERGSPKSISWIGEIDKIRSLGIATATRYESAIPGSTSELTFDL